MSEHTMIDRLDAALGDRYRTERELGEGGMATVYLAQDLKHNRKVAIKVLKPELAAMVGAERFLTEIETTANLQHPNILPLFDSGEADGLLYYIMPYVEGETLRERLDEERQLSVAEAVRVATAVANALHFAHEHGVVHRDIKPGNILFQAGQPVVGDFGIALALGAGGGARLTETGLSLGTPYYMSPEQATGDQRVDARSDVYALGCILYELLTGDPPFMGSTAQAVLGQVISGRPASATEKRASVPLHVDAAIRRALEKVPADRFETAKDFAAALANPGFRHGGDATRSEAAGSGWTRWGPWVLSAALGAGLVWALAFGASESADRTVRFTLPLAEAADASALPGGRVAGTRNPNNLLALSPDGSLLAYAAYDGEKPSLFLRALDRLETETLVPDDTVRSPFFSPDGEWLGFLTPSAVKRIRISTREAETVATGLPDVPWIGAAWGGDGVILLATVGAVLRVPASGGSLEEVPEIDPERQYASPHFLPGPTVLLHTSARGESDPGNADIVALDPETGEEKLLVEGAVAPRYATTGHLLFLREGTLYGVAFDPDRLEVVGEPVVLEERVMQASHMANSSQDSGEGQIALSASGDLVFAPGGVTPQVPTELTLVGPEGVRGTVDPASPGYREYHFVRYSPDGTRLAFHAGPGRKNDIGIHTFSTGATRMLDLGGFTNQAPLWSPDGEWLAFHSDSSGVREIYRIASDGTGGPERVLPAGTEATPYSWSSQGILAYGVWPEAEIWTLPPDGQPTLFVESAFDASFSPDGRWLAYRAFTRASAPPEVFLRPYPGPAAATQISNGGGANPAWSRDGSTLYYADTGDGSLMAVELGFDGGLRASRPTVHIADWEGCCRSPLRGYGVAPDGSLLLPVRTRGRREEAAFNAVEVVLGFGEELKRRIPD